MLSRFGAKHSQDRRTTDARNEFADIVEGIFEDIAKRERMLVNQGRLEALTDVSAAIRSAFSPLRADYMKGLVSDPDTAISCKELNIRLMSSIDEIVLRLRDFVAEADGERALFQATQQDLLR